MLGSRGRTRVDGATLRARFGLFDSWTYFTAIKTRRTSPPADSGTGGVTPVVARVPLIAWAPGRLAPDRVAYPVSLLDLAPTLLELCELPDAAELAAGMDGRSLVPLLAGEPAAPADVVAEYLAEGVRRSDFVLVVTTAPNGVLLRDALGADAGDIVFADAFDWYRSPGHALGAYRQILDEHCRPGARWARILGEPTWTQQSRAELVGWARYEAVINFVWASYPATVVCAYGTRTAPDDGVRYALQTHQELCSAAGEVRPNPQCSDSQEFMLNMP